VSLFPSVIYAIFKTSKPTFKQIDVRLLRKDVAVAHDQTELQGDATHEGSEMDPCGHDSDQKEPSLVDRQSLKMLAHRSRSTAPRRAEIALRQSSWSRSSTTRSSRSLDGCHFERAERADFCVRGQMPKTGAFLDVRIEPRTWLRFTLICGRRINRDCDYAEPDHSRSSAGFVLRIARGDAMPGDQHGQRCFRAMFSPGRPLSSPIHARFAGKKLLRELCMPGLCAMLGRARVRCQPN
jgi:hypothetical protein